MVSGDGRYLDKQTCYHNCSKHVSIYETLLSVDEKSTSPAASWKSHGRRSTTRPAYRVKRRSCSPGKFRILHTNIQESGGGALPSSFPEPIALRDLANWPELSNQYAIFDLVGPAECEETREESTYIS